MIRFDVFSIFTSWCSLFVFSSDGFIHLYSFKLLTPSNKAELEDVSAYVGVEDFDQSDVHVDGLQPHPGEGRQQEVVQEDGDGET